MAKQNKPAIRFKGFTDAWEQRKFSDLYAPLVERNSDLLPYNKTLSVATMTYKTDGNGAADSSLANYKRLRTGDIAFEGHTSKSFRYGRFVLNDVGDGIMSPRFSALRPLAQMPTNFWKYYIHYEPIMRKILVASTKAGTMMNELVIDEFLKSSVLVPSIEEQTRIGSILKNIDNLITLHQRKYDKLQVLKKAMLEKMFPKNGSSVPEIRFKGFTDAWEQRKAKDLCSISTGKSNTQDRVDDGIYPFYVRSPIVEHSNRYLFDEEAVLTVGDGVGTGKVFHYVNGKYDLHQRVYRMFDFSEEITAKYFYYYFSNHFYDRVMAMTAKTSVDSVRYEMIADMDIALPKVKEQMAISAYFDRLDHLITLHQRELEKLQNIKKSMLEKMFV